MIWLVIILISLENVICNHYALVGKIMYRDNPYREEDALS